jgi:hypothetical protein
MAWSYTGLVAALAGSLAAGCGGAAAGTSAFVGEVTDQGQDAVIGAVSDGARVSFYVCGGPSSYATMTKWIQGPVAADGTLDISGGGFRVTGRIGGEGQSPLGAGRIQTPAGEAVSWTVRPAVGSLEGLYQTMDGSCRTGAVVGDFGDGLGVRLQGTWCGGGSQYAQVTPIRSPLALEEGEDIAVRVEAADAQALLVSRLVAPLPPP